MELGNGERDMDIISVDGDGVPTHIDPPGK